MALCEKYQYIARMSLLLNFSGLKHANIFLMKRERYHCTASERELIFIFDFNLINTKELSKESTRARSTLIRENLCIKLST